MTTQTTIYADDGNCEMRYSDMTHLEAAQEYVRTGEWHVDEVGQQTLGIWTYLGYDTDGEYIDGQRHSIETADFFNDDNTPIQQ